MDVTRTAASPAAREIPALPARQPDPVVTRLVDAASHIYSTASALDKRLREPLDTIDGAMLLEAAEQLRGLTPTFEQIRRDQIELTHPSSPWITNMGELPLGSLYRSWHGVPSQIADAAARSAAGTRQAIAALEAAAKQPTADSVKHVRMQLDDVTDGVWVREAASLDWMRHFDTPARQAAKLLRDIDLDGDGRIDIATEHERQFEVEFRYVPTERHEIFTERLQSIDRSGNRDGVVTEPEATSFFRGVDSDRDGWLSAADLSAAQGSSPIVIRERIGLWSHDKPVQFGPWGVVQEAATER